MDENEKKKLSTNELMRRLFNTASIGKFMTRNDAEMSSPDFVSLINSHAAARGLEPKEIVKEAHIERVYGYQIFSGLRRPSRDKVLMLAVAMQLSIDDTQRLLRAAGRSELYARIKRDAAVLFGLNRNMHMGDMQALLEELGLPLLGGARVESDDAEA